MAAKEISVKKYVVRLSGEEREQLEALIRKGKSPARRLLKARILLKADVSDGRRRLERQPDHSCPGDQRVDGLPGAQAAGGRGLRGCVEPQAARDAGGCADFRRREGSQADCAGLLQAAQGTRALDLAVVGEQGRGTRHRRSRQRQHDRPRAKKNILKPHRRQSWVIPPKANSAFVAAMEDVLAVYTRPRDPDCPLVCLDETSKQLLAETRVPIPMKPGRPARFDYEYERNGTANLFMMFAPLEGWRHVKVTDRHTAVDYAHVLKDLADIHFPPPEPSFWSRTISTSTARLHSTKPFRPPKPGGWSSASNGTTRQNTAAGSIWRNPNSAFYRPNASIAAFPTNKPSSTKSPPGSTTAMPITPRPIGTSQPQTPASNSSTYTLQSD